MKIDCHTHFFPSRFMSEARKLGVDFRAIGDESFINIESRLKEMDKSGIDKQVLGLTVPGVDFAKPEDSLFLAKIVNDELARIADHDDRFISLVKEARRESIFFPKIADILKLHDSVPTTHIRLENKPDPGCMSGYEIVMAVDRGDLPESILEEYGLEKKKEPEKLRVVK